MFRLSIWERESFFEHRDVIIAGSGFVGLWCAYYLKKKHPKLSIAIIDRGLIPTGASTRNAGFACFGSVTELIADTLKMGEDKMLQIVEMRFKGLEKIRKIFRDRDIDYKELGGFELITPGQQLDPNILRSNLDFLNRKLKKIVGKNKTFRLDDSMIGGFGFSGVDHLVRNNLEGQLHSGKLCQALLRRVQSMGVTVLNNIEIKGFSKGNGKLEIQTNHSFELSCNRLLICTNAFARQLLPSLDVEPARGQVIVTSPLPDLKLRGCFHFDEGFYYFRNLGNRILLGGARNLAIDEERTSDFNTTNKIQNELERFLRETILGGRNYAIDYRWSGIMGIGAEKLPIVQQIGEEVYCAVRMSGMGVALAPEIGKQVAENMMK